VITEDNITLANGLCPSRTRYFQVFTAVHCGKESNKDENVESNLHRILGRSLCHASDCVEGDGFLWFFGGVIILIPAELTL
jgi:hypothetical protein